VTLLKTDKISCINAPFATKPNNINTRHVSDFYLSHCSSIAWDRLENYLRLFVRLWSLLRSQFWVDINETLHSHLGREN